MRRAGPTSLLASPPGLPLGGQLQPQLDNAAYGAKTPMCSFIAAMVIMICLLVLTPYLHNMPKVILASIVIAALCLVELDEVASLFHSK